jgi:hypothetical protein
MTANIVTFPKKFQKSTPLGVVIKLYTEEEIEMVLFCLNIFGDQDNSYAKEDLRSVDPHFTLDCMGKAYSSYLLSPDAKSIIHYIMKNVSEVTPPIMEGSR